MSGTCCKSGLWCNSGTLCKFGTTREGRSQSAHACPGCASVQPNAARACEAVSRGWLFTDAACDVQVCACVSEAVHVCVRVRDRVRSSTCACVCMCVCVPVCVCELAHAGIRENPSAQLGRVREANVCAVQCSMERRERGQETETHLEELAWPPKSHQEREKARPFVSVPGP